MICTCTMNPSLDYYMELDKPIADGELNRSELEYFEAGGKGINVSIVLNNLQIPNYALGFLGGFTKDHYITLLSRYEYIRPNFSYIDGHTRVNIKLSDGKSYTTLNASGPVITNHNMENLAKKVDRLGTGDFFVLAGICPGYLVEETVKMCQLAIEDGVRVCLDTNSSIIHELLPYKPFLVKASTRDLENAFGHPYSFEEAKQVAIDSHNKGAKNVVMIDSDHSQALIVCDEGIYSAILDSSNSILSVVGVGDSLVAGFLMSMMRGTGVVESFKYGCCCGSATAFSKSLATRQKIEELYQTMVITKIG